MIVDSKPITNLFFIFFIHIHKFKLDDMKQTDPTKPNEYNETKATKCN